MDKPINLSIVIPVYNGALTIGRTVDELVKLNVQRYVEIILVNDGSTITVAMSVGNLPKLPLSR